MQKVGPDCHGTPLTGLPYNRGMSHLDILVPFSLPPPELSADLLKELKAPSLAILAARANWAPQEQSDAFSRTLPHEAWLSRRFGLGSGLAAENSPPIAAAAISSLNIQAPEGFWFIVQPVHIHIARDHLVLTDPRRLELPEQESRALFEVARDVFHEYRLTLLYGNSTTWFARSDEWKQLKTATIDAATGHNIDVWMPRGDGERAWRKVQNDVQMHWFGHPVNAMREAAGKRTINSLWLWGGARAGTLPADPAYSATFNLQGWMQIFRAHGDWAAAPASAADVLGLCPDRGLVMLDDLVEPALSNDWGSWLQAFERLEAGWFAPLLESLRDRKVRRLSLIFSHNSGLTSCTATGISLHKFWIRPSLERLCP